MYPNAEAASARLERITGEIARRWREADPECAVTARVRRNGTLDITLVSRLFEGREVRDRERDFWTACGDISREDTVTMTSTLLLSPAEAQRLREAETPEPADNWA